MQSPRSAQKKLILVAGAVGALAFASSGLVSPALADEASTTSSTDEPTLVANDPTVIPGSEVRAAASEAQTAPARAAAEQDVLDDSAADGMLLDQSQVNSSIVDDATVVWTDGTKVNDVSIQSADDTTTTAREEIPTAVGFDVDDGYGTVIEQGANGSGRISSITGTVGDHTGGIVSVAKNYDGYTYTVKSGWDRVRLQESKPGRDIYYYGHWGVAEGASRVGFDGAPYRIYIASRPKEGHRGDFLQLRDYWPKTDSPSCDSQGTINVGFNAFGADLPLANCSNLEPSANINDIQMNNTWSAGSCKDQTTEGVDLAMLVDVDPGLNAILSDHTWAKFNNTMEKCTWDPTATPEWVYLTYNDPGW